MATTNPISSGNGLPVAPIVIPRSESGSGWDNPLFALFAAFLNWIASIFCASSSLEDREVVNLTNFTPSIEQKPVQRAAVTFRKAYPLISDTKPIQSVTQRKEKEKKKSQAEKFVELVDNYIAAFRKKDAKEANIFSEKINENLEWLGSIDVQHTTREKEITTPALEKLNKFEKENLKGIHEFIKGIKLQNKVLSKINSLDSHSLTEYRNLYTKIMEELSFINELNDHSFISKNAIAQLLKTPLEEFTGHLERLHTPTGITKGLKENIKQLFEKQALVMNYNAGISQA